MRGNELLVLAAGNQYPAQAIAPYATFPSWWRRFMFQVLEPRSQRVYFYLATLFDANSIAYPLQSQIMEDLGIKNRASLNLAIEELEARGFIVTGERTLPRQAKDPRTIYQRTAPEFTLLTLLKAKLIDGDLNPIGDGTTRSDSSTSAKAVEFGLRAMLGEVRLARYYGRETEPERRKALVLVLEERLAERIVLAERRAKRS